MTAEDKTITLFSTRVRQLIIQFEKLKKENASLREMLDERDSRIRKMEDMLSTTQKDFENLKTARMLEVSEGDLDAAKAKLNKLVRSVNKCITLLSEK
ncbi:MAG: hypothetical protein J5637_04485 [Prevotella sp.]|nr:hypothetical protein [Prevotella sp.]